MMKPGSRGSLSLWIGVLLLIVVSFVVVIVRMGGLSQLPVFLGPDLTVRTVRMDRALMQEAQQFQRGDRLVAVQRQAVDDLRDLRMVLANFSAPSESSVDDLGAEALGVGADYDDESGQVEEEPEQSVLIDYQIVRPLHRFTLALQGEQLEPASLPAGVEAKDRLVEIDGRALPAVGPEGLRSIIASRPDALLGFERPNAVFVGQMRVPAPQIHKGIALTFVLALLLAGSLWRFSNRSLHPLSSVAIAVETLGIAWLFLLAFEYQWLIADYGMTAIVVVGLVMMRPLAIYARDQSVNRSATRGKLSLGLGLLTSVSIVVLLYSQLPNAETALHMAAIFAALFIVYEIVITGYEQGSRAMFGERGGYLVGIVLLGLFACVVAAFMEPVAFEEDRWRWFAVLVPALVWFGDVLFCFRQPNGQSVGELLDADARSSTLLAYFQGLRRELPQAELQLVVYREQSSVVIADRTDELGVYRASEALHDAVSILIQENAQIPLAADVERESHPMDGIAQAMHMIFAQRLEPPQGAASLQEAALVILGVQDFPAKDEQEEQALAESLELAEKAQKNLSHRIWMAAWLEGLDVLSTGAVAESHGDEKGGELPSGEQEKVELQESSAQNTVLQDKIAQLEEEVSQHASAYEVLTHGYDVLSTRVSFLEQQAHVGFPTLSECEQLLEADLIAGLRYLAESKEAIVVAGAEGAGKEFTSWCAHLLEGRPPGRFGSYDASLGNETLDNEILLGLVKGDAEGPRPMAMFEQCRGGSILIRSCELLGDHFLLTLCDAAQAHDVRLFLSFTADDAEERSVLEGRNTELYARLGERELILPRFTRRRSIMRAVLEKFLWDSTRIRGKRIDGFSNHAWQALEAYDYPGEISEARTIVDVAVAVAAHDVIDLEDLSLEVQRF